MVENEQGAVVVEVSFIIPVIFLIVMMVLFFLFFFFDMGVIRSEACRSANEVAREWRNTEHMSIEDAEGSLKDRIEERLILADVASESVSVMLGTVTVKVGIRFLLAGKGLEFSQTVVAAVNQREEWMRIVGQS